MMKKLTVFWLFIAEEAGFSSRTTFYRHFREKYGLSPEEFRRSIKWNART